MTQVWTQQRTLRLAGLIGIAAALVAMIGDEILQYSPQGYASLTYYQSLPVWRIFTGHVLGVLAIPLCLIGYWCVCQALRLGGAGHTRLLFWLMAYGLVMGAISHDALSIYFELARESGGPALTPAMNYINLYSYVPGIIFLLCYLLSSIWYSIVVVSKQTLYPRWMVFFSPILLSLIILFLNSLNVFPLALNVLWPAWLSFPHLVLFSLSTIVLWNAEIEGVTAVPVEQEALYTD